MVQVRTGYKRSLTVLITKSINGSVADGYPKQYPTATDILNGYFTYMGIHYTIPTPEQLALMDQLDYNYLLLRFKQYIYFTETGFVSDDFSSDAEIYDPEECVEGIITTTTTTSEPTTTPTTEIEPTTTTSTTELCCYGLLYNWQTTQGSDGESITSSDDWRVPSSSDINTLLGYIDPLYQPEWEWSETAGSSLKQLSCWESPNTG